MEKKKILIVDDEKEIRELTKEFLEKKGYDALAVESALLGLNILKTHSFDALISDIRMPYMDGIEFAKRAKAINPNLIIIMLTGYGSLDTAQEAIKIGVYDYLTKPVDLEKLSQSLNEGLIKMAEQKKNFEYYLKLKKETEDNKQRLNSMKDELMTLISHELRTPLTVILDAFSLLKETMMVPSEEKMQAIKEEDKEFIFKAIEDGHSRLNKIIEEINYYMALKREDIVLNKTKVNLSSFLEENFEGFIHLIANKKAHLKKEFTEKEQLVSIDKEKFLDVLSRLIHNSAYHNPEGVEIVLKLSSIKRKKEESPQENWTKIEVCDNGRGMEAKVLENIFSPFSVGNIDYHTEGIGLSLPICQKVIQLHNGTIKVDSRQGKGTKVSIELPQLPS